MHLYKKAKDRLVPVPKEMIAKLLDLRPYFTVSEFKQKVGIDFNIAYQTRQNKRRRIRSQTLERLKAFIEEVEQRKIQFLHETAIYVM